VAVQLVGIGVTLPSVGVSLTPTTLQMAWSGESLIGTGVSIVQSTLVSTVALVYVPSWPYYGF
jgi:hypothetical protein